MRTGQVGGQLLDPYGWSPTPGAPVQVNPWLYNQGYLWTTNPPSLTPPNPPPPPPPPPAAFIIQGPGTPTWTLSTLPEADLWVSAPGVSASTSGITVPAGASANLAWCGSGGTACANAAACSVAQSGSQTPIASGVASPAAGFSTGPLAGAATYTLTCSNPWGAASDSVTVSVAPPPQADLWISAWGNATSTSGVTITGGVPAKLHWCGMNGTPCANASACAIVQTTGAGATSTPWGGVSSPLGGQSTGGIATSTTYTLTCAGPGGTASDSVTATVTLPPPTPVVCFPSVQIAPPNTTVGFQVSGGVQLGGPAPFYQWSAPGGNPSSGTGTNFATVYPPPPSSHTVLATNAAQPPGAAGQTDDCIVVVQIEVPP